MQIQMYFPKFFNGYATSTEVKHKSSIIVLYCFIIDL